MRIRKFKSPMLFLVAVLAALTHTIGAAPYDVHAPAFPIIYRDAEKAEQRVAGQKLVAQINTAITARQSSFTVPPGVYRLDGPLDFVGVKNFALLCAESKKRRISHW